VRWTEENETLREQIKEEAAPGEHGMLQVGAEDIHHDVGDASKV